MKKIVTFMTTMLLSVVLFAQFSSQREVPMGKTPINQSRPFNDPGPMNTAGPEWHPIHTPFTVTDINGDTVSVADTLAAGKCVIICYDVAWNTPGYQFHNAKHLYAIHNQLRSQVCVLWVEVESRNTVQQIYGTSMDNNYGSTVGDWTHYSDNTAVPYRIIDCASCQSIVDATGFVPEVDFIAPSGYYTQIYGETWGVTISMTNAQAVSNIQALISSYPRAGQVPTSVLVNGPNIAFVGTPVTFNTSYISVDSVTGINWTTTGGTPATDTGSSTTVTYTTAGTHTVGVAVTNTTGTTTASKTITVRSMGDTMDYTDGGAFVSHFYPDSEWGVLYPASLMTGRNYLTTVSAYIISGETGQYTVRVYQGGTTSPQTLLYQHVYSVTTSGQWVNLPIYGGLALNTTQSMWVSLSTSYGTAASYTTYNGDTNSSLLLRNTVWSSLMNATNGSIQGTWMIKTVTSATQPPLAVTIDGPSIAMAGSPVTFSAVCPTGVSYNWTLSGATPATATGDTVTATWFTAGTYNVILTATRGTQTATDTHMVTITDCIISSFPYTMGFSPAEPTFCWTTEGSGGDGQGWSVVRGVSSYYMMSTTSSYDSLPPDNWLISPLIDLSTTRNAVLSWFSSQYRNDHYTVYVSATGNTVADFLQGVSANITQTNSDTVYANLNAFSGQQIYIAFRHNTRPANNYNYGDVTIRNITITGTYTPRVVNTITCTGSRTGAVYRGTTSGTSLCGQSDTIWFGQNYTYNFIPDMNSYFLSGLFVNDTSRMSEVTTRTVGSRRVYSLGSSYAVNSTIRAVFEPEMFTVIVSSADSTMGIVSGGGTFAADSIITLTATPMPHYHLVSWTILDEQGTHTSNENPLNYMVSSNATITANFEVDQYTIIVSPNNVAYGMVSGGGTFTYLDVVTVTATAFSGYYFSHWSNGATYNPYIFPAMEDLNLTAIFVAEGDTSSHYFTITVTANDSTMGSVTGGGMFPMGATATLVAIPNAGYRFVQWQDANTENPRTITVTTDAEYIGYFASEINIDDVQSEGATVSVLMNDIHVTGVAGKRVVVYDIAGRLIASANEPGVDGYVFRMPTTGVYLVQVGGNPAQRVVVR